MTTVVKVDTTNDLKYCKIHVSIFGEKDIEKRSNGRIGKCIWRILRKLLATRINLRNTPSLTFVLDDSLEYSIKISKLIDECEQKIHGNKGNKDDTTKTKYI